MAENKCPRCGVGLILRPDQRLVHPGTNRLNCSPKEATVADHTYREPKPVRIGEREYWWSVDDALRAEIYCPDGGQEHMKVHRPAEVETGAVDEISCLHCGYVFS